MLPILISQVFSGEGSIFESFQSLRKSSDFSVLKVADSIVHQSSFMDKNSSMFLALRLNCLLFCIQNDCQ